MEKRADQAFSAQNYQLALPDYRQLLAKNQQNPKYNFCYGVCIFETDQHFEAAKYFDVVIGLRQIPDPLLYYYRARIFQEQYFFKEAIEAYRTYSELTSTLKAKRDVSLPIEECETALKEITAYIQLPILDLQTTSSKQFYKNYPFALDDYTFYEAPEVHAKNNSKHQFVPVYAYKRGMKYRIFASYGPKGEQLDLYIQRKDAENNWGEIQAIEGGVSLLNSNESYGFYDPISQVLYFSSTSKSIGASDLFKAQYDLSTNTVSNIEKMAYPYSSPAEDLFYVTDHAKGQAYFASARQGKVGQLEIYTLQLDRPAVNYFVFAGSLTNERDPLSKSVALRFKDPISGITYGPFVSDNNGAYTVALPKVGNYILEVEIAGASRIYTTNFTLPNLQANMSLRQQVLYSSDEFGIEKWQVLNQLLDADPSSQIAQLSKLQLQVAKGQLLQTRNDLTNSTTAPDAALAASWGVSAPDTASFVALIADTLLAAEVSLENQVRLMDLLRQDFESKLNEREQLLSQLSSELAKPTSSAKKETILAALKQIEAELAFTERWIEINRAANIPDLVLLDTLQQINERNQAQLFIGDTTGLIANWQAQRSAIQNYLQIAAFDGSSALEAAQVQEQQRLKQIIDEQAQNQAQQKALSQQIQKLNSGLALQTKKDQATTQLQIAGLQKDLAQLEVISKQLALKRESQTEAVKVYQQNELKATYLKEAENQALPKVNFQLSYEELQAQFAQQESIAQELKAAAMVTSSSENTSSTENVTQVGNSSSESSNLSSNSNPSSNSNYSTNSNLPSNSNSTASSNPSLTSNSSSENSTTSENTRSSENASTTESTSSTENVTQVGNSSSESSNLSLNSNSSNSNLPSNSNSTMSSNPSLNSNSSSENSTNSENTRSSENSAATESTSSTENVTQVWNSSSESSNLSSNSNSSTNSNLPSNSNSTTSSNPSLTSNSSSENSTTSENTRSSENASTTESTSSTENVSTTENTSSILNQVSEFERQAQLLQTIDEGADPGTITFKRLGLTNQELSTLDAALELSQDPTIAKEGTAEFELSSEAAIQAYVKYIEQRTTFEDTKLKLQENQQALRQVEQNYKPENKLELLNLLATQAQLKEQLLVQHQRLQQTKEQAKFEALLAQKYRPQVTTTQNTGFGESGEGALARSQSIFSIEQNTTSREALPINLPCPDGLVFRVQVGAFRKPVPADKFREFSPVDGKVLANGLTVYMAGYFSSSAEALQQQAKIRTYGYTDAFVVAYDNCNRLSLAQGRALEAKQLKPQQQQQQIAQNNLFATPGQGLYYSVQVGVYNKPLTSQAQLGLPELIEARTQKGQFRYASGKFADLKQAKIRQQQAVAKGITDAFIVAYYQGKRIDLAQAKALADAGIAFESFEQKSPQPQLTTAVQAQLQALQLPVKQTLVLPDPLLRFELRCSDCQQELTRLNRVGVFTYDEEKAVIMSPLMKESAFDLVQLMYMKNLRKRTAVLKGSTENMLLDASIDGAFMDFLLRQNAAYELQEAEQGHYQLIYQRNE